MEWTDGRAGRAARPGGPTPRGRRRTSTTTSHLLALTAALYDDERAPFLLLRVVATATGAEGDLSPPSVATSAIGDTAVVAVWF